MAKKYNPTPTNRVEDFVSFLNSNKAGTIFESATISGSYYTMNISLNGTQIAIRTIKNTSSAEYAIVLNKGSKKIEWGLLKSETTLMIAGMLLANNGLIIKLTNNTSNTQAQYVAIFVDSNNELSFAYSDNTVYSSNYTQYVSVSISSISQDPTTITPQYNATLTSLALMTPTTGDNTIYFPNAFVAVATQLPGVGMYIVTINDNVYITNGIWYIPD